MVARISSLPRDSSFLCQRHVDRSLRVDRGRVEKRYCGMFLLDEHHDLGAALDDALGDLVNQTAPSLLECYGVGVVTAATLLITAGDNWVIDPLIHYSYNTINF